MKKTFTFILMILSFFVLASAKNFTITIHGNYFSTSDSNLADNFGKKKYFPEGKVSLRIAGNFFLWSSYGAFSKNKSWPEWSNKVIEEADIEVEDIFKKNIISCGLGYHIGYIEKDEFSVKVEIGACKITNDQETTARGVAGGNVLTSEKKKESGLGVRGNMAITYGIYKSFFTEISVGYLYATDKVAGTTVKLGGMMISLGLGFRF